MSLETQKTMQKDRVSLDGIFQEDVQTIYNICSACTGYDTCTFPINLSRPILHCAEFKPFPSRAVSSFSNTSRPAVKASGIDAKSKYIGLCRNCDLKDDCTFGEAGKSILNCEEYQ